MFFTLTLKKWGNSLGVRIPQPILNEIDLHEDQIFRVEVVHGKIILTPTRKRPTLDDLIKNVTPELVGGEYEWGPDIGAEIYE